MPALTIPPNNTDDPPSQPASPTRPPMSPITPTLGPSRAGHQPQQTQPPELNLNDASSNRGRDVYPQAAAFTHNSHPDQVPSIPAPAPQPIDFEDNVDVIALKSAISTLQMQSRRAEEDIRTLRDVKAEALQRPEDFARHIARVTDHSGSSDGGDAAGTQWPRLPERISVARCPPINWSQYAVSGQALDNLHNEQVARPFQGAPATFADGAYDHKTGSGNQEQYLGPTAPYDPQRDRVERKVKGKK